MNRSSYLIVCLDACRYDSFRDAETPNFDQVGELKRAYSVAGYTPSTLMGLLINMPPYNTEKKKFIQGYPRSEWLPAELKKKGYYNAFLTSNALMLMHKGIFGRGFQEYEGLQYDHEYAADEIIKRDREILKEKLNRPKFIFNLLMATHYPYSDGNQVYPKKRQSQMKALKAVDREFGNLLPQLKRVEVTILSDHGELFQEDGCASHSPDGAPFHPKIFEIPFIRGEML